MSSSLPRFHSLRVADLRRETPDAVSIAFEVPEALKPLYGFRPGQYLTLRRDFEGEEVRRSYSITSSASPMCSRTLPSAPSRIWLSAPTTPLRNGSQPMKP